MIALLHIFLWLGILSPAHAAPVADLSVTAPEYDSGLTLKLSWTLPPEDGDRVAGYLVLRSEKESGPWELVTGILPAGTQEISDKVTSNPSKDPPKDAYWYRVANVTDALLVLPGEDTSDAERDAFIGSLLQQEITTPAVGNPEASLLRTGPGHILLMLLIPGVGILMFVFTKQAREGKEIFIRRIAGIDAIEEGIGRATEMGRPVLYVPGIDELQDIQTIASMLILGQVSKTVAEYQSDIIVSCCIPIVREVADEVVRSGYYLAGFPDDYRSTNTRFISSEQFAFCAGTNGIMLREKTSTNFYFGRFFAESLILAETGFVNRSIQIAGTAEATQLPFFIAACDYTLIGEELFAVSAYLSKDPRLVSSLKASDWVKLFVVACLLLGTILNSIGITWFVTMYTITGG